MKSNDIKNLKFMQKYGKLHQQIAMQHKDSIG